MRFLAFVRRTALIGSRNFHRQHFINGDSRQHFIKRIFIDIIIDSHIARARTLLFLRSHKHRLQKFIIDEQN